VEGTSFIDAYNFNFSARWPVEVACILNNPGLVEPLALINYLVSVFEEL